jgi:hypothetical protein
MAGKKIKRAQDLATRFLAAAPWESARRHNVKMPDFIEDYWAPRHNIAP